MARLGFLSVIFFIFFSQAARFEDFLSSLNQKLPINMTYMKNVLQKTNTRLAHPSALERWGLINSAAEASYNSFLNTIVLKEDLTIQSKLPSGENSRRLQNWNELRKLAPNAWPIKMGVIFHEMSHAEYSWLRNSRDPVDAALYHILDVEFPEYIKQNHPEYNFMERSISSSEMFAYFREEAFVKIIREIDELFFENGYMKHRKECKNLKPLLAKLNKNPALNPMNFVLVSDDSDFTKMPLPTIYVNGNHLDVNPKHVIYNRLKKALWDQFISHYSPATSKAKLIEWLNSGPRLQRLIKPCREQYLELKRQSAEAEAAAAMIVPQDKVSEQLSY